eukprot:TRINITY_DN2583_c0_g1_i1.p1 TRINITY_DN2583_c0_g1~~TRINITY_DN2583_c0_g1_i1.p1  ORF type:complete len:648 (-),score=132.40 TRINITY_DN2583_c0_g1_i1:302-2245(-)
MALPLQIDDSTPTLPLRSVVGFGGSVVGGLQKHPRNNFLVYPLGPTLVVRDVTQWSGEADSFLEGHTDTISAVAISPDGSLVASGQEAPLGFQATVCIFDLAERRLRHRLNIHKGRVEAVAWSHDCRYVASVGGKDDNTVVVWDAEAGRPLCGGPASAETTLCVTFLRTDASRFVTAGHGGIRMWHIDVAARRVVPTDVKLAGMTRVVRCVAVDETDSQLYAGTSTGDVLAVQLSGVVVLRAQGPTRTGPLAQGVTTLSLTPSGDVLVGSGAGALCLLTPDLKMVQQVQLQGGITSALPDGAVYWCGTGRGNIYTVSAKTFKEDLRLTCHAQRVNAVTFPKASGAVFATCSGGDIRVWKTATGEVLLRLAVPGLECNALIVTDDGGQIVSGWSDGTIRAFGPQSGRYLYTVHDAHKTTGIKRVSGSMTGVTALACAPDSTRIISGGADGQVRVWAVMQGHRLLEATLKEHKHTVNAIAVSPVAPEVCTASDDGTCIIWDLARRLRRNIVYAQTYFRSVAYLPDGSQFLTTGSDRRVTFYGASDCAPIRALEGSKEGEVNSLAISPDGCVFASGGADGTLKVWDYDEGTVLGVGTAGRVTDVAFSPDKRTVVAVSADGGVFIFDVDSLRLSSSGVSARGGRGMDDSME